MMMAAVKVLLKIHYGVLPKSINTVLSNRLYGQVSAMCGAYFLKYLIFILTHACEILLFFPKQLHRRQLLQALGNYKFSNNCVILKPEFWFTVNEA